MLVKYWRLFQPFHRVFGWFLVLIVIYESAQIAEGYVMSFVIRLFGMQPQLFVWILLFAGLLIFDEAFMRLDNAFDWHIMSRQGYPIYKFLKLNAVAKFLSLDIPWHQKHNSGALVGKVANGVEKVNDIMSLLSWEFMPTFIQTVLSLIPLIYFSPHTALVATIAFLLFLWLTLKSNKEKGPFRARRYDLYETEWHRSMEIVQSAETNKMFGQDERLMDEQESLHNEIIDLGNKEERISIFKYNRLRIRILTICRRTVLAIWIWQLYNGTLDVANLIFVSILTEKLFHSFWRIVRLFDKAAEASEGAKRLADLMDAESNVETVDVAPQIIPPIGISMKEVCFSYDGEYSEDEGALHNFNLEIEPSTVVALVGLSGAGKTTIRKVITGLFEIQSGGIEVGGVNIRDWPKKALLNQFSYVPQGDDVFIFATTVKDNIAFPRPEAMDLEIITAAKLAGIHDFIMTLPEKYNTFVGERGKRLSGGQKQRVALARAILADRAILILDEATSSVDAITEHEIQTQMKAILHGKTAIIIAHRLSTVWDIADKIVVMAQGRKVEEGTHLELVRFGGLYKRLVELQTA